MTLRDVLQDMPRDEHPGVVDVIMKLVQPSGPPPNSPSHDATGYPPLECDPATCRAIIDAATETGEFVSFRQSRQFACGIDGAVDCLEDVLASGHAAEAVELAERALRRCELALANMDDSNGCMASVLARLQDLHHAACVRSKADPVALARKLFLWERGSQWGLFARAAKTYGDVLGKSGLAAYRRLVDRAGRPSPSAGGEDRDSANRRSRTASRAEPRPKASGKGDQMPATPAGDMTSSHDYLKIAEACRRARRPDEALEWAEKGILAFPDEAGGLLLGFLADEYRRRGRYRDAVEMAWRRFVKDMSLAFFKMLKSHADRCNRWPVWREKALAEICSVLEKVKQGAIKIDGDSWPAYRLFGDHSVLVEIFLWEGDPDAAWREAQAGGCNNDLWMRLAKLREKDHPADAAGVYQKQIDSLVCHKAYPNYPEAARLLRKIKKLQARLGRQEEFREFLSMVRASYKLKRNFMAMIERL